jgi:hypothetical protein
MVETIPRFSTARERLGPQTDANRNRGALRGLHDRAALSTWLYPASSRDSAPDVLRASSPFECLRILRFFTRAMPAASSGAISLLSAA